MWSSIFCTLCNNPVNNDMIKCTLCTALYHSYCAPTAEPNFISAALRSNFSLKWFCSNCKSMENCMADFGELINDINGNLQDINVRLSTVEKENEKSVLGDDNDVCGGVKTTNKLTFSEVLKKANTEEPIRLEQSVQPSTQLQVQPKRINSPIPNYQIKIPNISVAGTGVFRPGTSRLRAAPKLEWFHLKGVHADCITEDVSGHINKVLQIKEEDIFCKKTNTNKPIPNTMYKLYFSTFKIGVPTEYAEKIMRPNVWPEGILISKFIRYGEQSS